MPRVTKAMKLAKIAEYELKLTQRLMMVAGFSINADNNVVDERGDRLVFGKDHNKKFLKWGDGPFRYRELKFDPINNYSLMVQLFSSALEQMAKENKESGQGFDYVRTVILKDGEFLECGVQNKYVEVDIVSGKLESERYICPTLGYLELLLCLNGMDTPRDHDMLRELDVLKHEMEQ